MSNTTTIKFGTPIEYTNDFSNISNSNILATRSYVSTVIVNYGTSGGTAGWATNAGNAYALNNQNASFYLDRTNHTGTQTVSTISDIATNGTAGWATNSANTYLLNGQNSDYYSGMLLDTLSVAPYKSFKLNNDYKGPGQITLTNGSSALLGINTFFTDATVPIGFNYWQGFFVLDSANNWYRIYTSGSVTDDTHASMTSHYNRADIRSGYVTQSGATFTGVTGTYDYYLVKNISDGYFTESFGNNSYADSYGIALGGSTIAINGFAYGLNAFASGLQSFSTGNYSRATGNYSFAGGKGFSPLAQKTALAAGQTSFAYFEANTSQTAGHGAQGANSAILGGLNGNVPADSPRSIVLGGNAVKARAATADMVYVPSLNIATTPNAGTSGTNLELLARYNSGATGDVAKLTLGAGFNVAAGTISISTTASTITDFNNTVLSLIPSGTAGWATNTAHAFTADSATLAANSTLFNGQNDTFYRNRSNHTGSQTVSTISDIATNGTAGFALVAATALNASFNASNGLTKTGSTVSLGGSLTAATTLTLGDNNLTISAASTQGFGLKYAADYSSQFTSRSLVDKAYVDTHFTAGNTARSIGFSTDGNGQVISTGIKGYIVAGFTGTITGWDIVADKVGTIVVDVWKGTGSVPTVANSITGSQQPTLSSTQFNSSTNVSTWTTNVTLGDIIVFNVTGATLITKVTVTIRMIQ